MKNLHGRTLLTNPAHTKSTGFTHAERELYGLRGLLPYNVANLDQQIERVLGRGSMTGVGTDS